MTAIVIIVARLVQYGGAWTTGSLAVGLLVLTGIINSWVVIGRDYPWHALGTAYGQLLLVKLLFFAGMISLAAANRFAHTPALSRAIRKGGDIGKALTTLHRSILAEAGFALLVLIAVSWHGTLGPTGRSMRSAGRRHHILKYIEKSL